MAGHSHWANIAFKKGLVDKKRGKLFGKLARYIIVAARRGGGDPAANLALRYAIDRAKKASMPNDTIDRAVKKGTGELETETYDEVLYEGYGPNGVAILCEILTENRNRTAGEIRKLFEVNGGNLGSTGCVAWMFERQGVIQIPVKSVSEDRLFEIALEAGASDVRQVGETFEVICTPDVFQEVTAAIDNAKIPTDSAEVLRVASNTIDLDADAARNVLKLMEALEDHDDVQSVTANFNISESVMAELEATST
jgi:YebC/PmpR family DNA-binding regulatory protein